MRLTKEEDGNPISEPSDHSLGPTEFKTSISLVDLGMDCGGQELEQSFLEQSQKGTKSGIRRTVRGSRKRFLGNEGYKEGIGGNQGNKERMCWREQSKALE